MSRVPKGYVELTRSTDGKTFIVDARGLCVFPPAVEDAARKTCGVASVYYDDGGWIVAESFDEVRAKLAAALGEQDAPKQAALDPLIERAHLFATFCACESGEVKDRAKAWLADYDAAVRAYKESL